MRFLSVLALLALTACTLKPSDKEIREEADHLVRKTEQCREVAESLGLSQYKYFEENNEYHCHVYYKGNQVTYFFDEELGSLTRYFYLKGNLRLK